GGRVPSLGDRVGVGSVGLSATAAAASNSALMVCLRYRRRPTRTAQRGRAHPIVISRTGRWLAKLPAAVSQSWCAYALLRVFLRVPGSGARGRVARQATTTPRSPRTRGVERSGSRRAGPDPRRTAMTTEPARSDTAPVASIDQLRTEIDELDAQIL